MATTYWWTCGCYPCRDRMAEADRCEVIRRDRDAHIDAEHPDWHATERELAISHWSER